MKTMHDEEALPLAGRRLDTVLQRIRAAAIGAGRDPAGVRLIAIGKTHPASALKALHAAGQVDFGENRVQEATAKVRALQGAALCWHMVGQLQSNKAAAAAAVFDWIHSLDSPKLARRLSAAADAANRCLHVLAQVSMDRHPGRGGVQEADLAPLLKLCRDLPALSVEGLMVVPPLGDGSASAARPWFKRLSQLACRLAERQLLPAQPELSMGMSGDFEVAIEEGATMVRVGTALFGKRGSVSG